jgi:hypothetical protein
MNEKGVNALAEYVAERYDIYRIPEPVSVDLS